MTPRLAGLILAAGASSRMGRPKALLPIGRTSFVGRIAAALRTAGLTDLIVVTAPALVQDVTEALASLEAPPATVVVNAHPERGQLSSLVAGLDAAEAIDAAGVVMCPVDVPLFAPATVTALVAASTRPGLAVARPAWKGRHGHPVVFMRRLFGPLRAADPAAGARAVVRAHAGDTADVEIDDPGAFVDIDTPADYETRVRQRFETF